mmetsp:Transcript_24184/g.29685  ORF Transcript_24184/g.29685 Transcript_24184/m.29685 type:complete len:215 (-) Transcript_24184:1544-2188(-)
MKKSQKYLSNDSEDDRDDNLLRRSNRRRDSVIQYTGDRESLRFREERPTMMGEQTLRRQQRVPFDVNRISPLLQQYFGNDNGNNHREQIIKRTVPVDWCATGGVDTYRKKHACYSDRCNIDISSFVVSKLCSEQYSETQPDVKCLIDQYKTQRNEFLKESKDAAHHHTEKIRAIEQSRLKILKGGNVDTVRRKMNVFALDVMEKRLSNKTDTKH